MFRLMICCVAIVAPALAQQFTFEVASIKESRTDVDGRGFTTNRGGLKTENTTLRDLIVFALRVQDYQVTGGPVWINDAHYDVTARVESSEEKEIPDDDRRNREAQDERLRARVRHLLADRFALQLREEKKEMSVYALAVDKPGSKLKTAALPKGNMTVSNSSGAGSIQGEGIGIDRLCRTLGNILQKPVVDETGLDGVYDVDFKFTMDTNGSEKELEDAGAPIFTALREKLGLRLTGKKAPVSVWVIERAEKPSEN